jgi:hypothetical protein
MSERQLRRLANEGRIERRVRDGRVEYLVSLGEGLRRRAPKAGSRQASAPSRLTVAAGGDPADAALATLASALRAGAAARLDLASAQARIAELESSLARAIEERERIESQAQQLADSLKKRAEVVRDLAARLGRYETA